MREQSPQKRSICSGDKEGGSTADLPAKFCVTMPDDTMPPLLEGHTVVLETGLAPRPGDWVLVADASDSWFIREYRPRGPGHWQAAPLNPAYEALDSERDGLRVLAVFVGAEGRFGMETQSGRSERSSARYTTKDEAHQGHLDAKRRPHAGRTP